MQLSLIPPKYQSKLIAETVPTFSYQDYPLTKPKSIRVFELQKSSDYETPLEGSLTCTTLESSYVALSYCWGEPSQNETILINGCVFKITEQLRNAIRRIRCGRHCTIWIDQICINQDDEAEKTQQVRMMGQIYANAKNTFAYLGADSSNLAPLMQKLGQMRYGISPEPEHDTSMHDDFLRILESQQGMQVRDIVLALYSFWNDAFFSRLWVVQECVLSGSERLKFLLGDHTLDWNEIRAGFWALNHVNMSKMWLKEEYDDLELFESTTLQRLAWTTGIFRMQRLVERMDAVEGSAFRSTLYGLTGFTQHMTCKDPRDRFFALHSIAIDPQLPSIDYSKTVADVYIEHNADFVRRGHGTSLLWKIMYRDNVQDSDIPSWCLRHTTGYESAHESTSFLRSLTTDDDDVCFGGPTQTPEVIEERFLMVKALKLDKIKAEQSCSEEFASMQPQDNSKIARFVVDSIETLAINHFSRGNDRRTSLIKALEDLRRLLLPIAKQFAGFRGVSLANEDTVLRMQSKPEDWEDWKTAFYDAVAGCTGSPDLASTLILLATNCRVFVTERGFPCLSSVNTRAGDVVAVLADVKQFVLLRPQDDDTWRLLWVARVEGLINPDDPMYRWLAYEVGWLDIYLS